MRPWWLIAFGFFMTFGASFGQTFFISLYAEPIMLATGLSNTGYSSLYSLATFGSAVGLLLLGKLVDHHPTSRMALFTFFGLIAGCLLLAASITSLMVLLAFWLLRFFGGSMPGQVSSSMLSREFTSKRGRAISLSNMGYPAGQALFPLVAVGLATLVGWRWSWVIFAALLLLGFIPLVRYMLRRGQPSHPIHSENSGLSHPVGQNGWSRTEVMRDPVFYCIVPALSAGAFLLTGVLFHQVAIANDRGWSLTVLASSHTAFAAVQIATTLGIGFAIDRFTARGVSRWALVPLFISSLALAVGDTLFSLWMMMIFAGMAMGVLLPLSITLLTELYGTRHIGAIKSLSLMINVIGTALAPVIYGLLLDADLGSHSLGWFGLAYLLLATIGIWAGLGYEARRRRVGLQ